MKYSYRIWLSVWLVLFLFQSLPATAVQSPLLMGLPRTQNDYYGKLAIIVYDEIFRRLGVPWQFKSCVPTQCGKYVTQGKLDGELARTQIYQKQYPTLVRCSEPVLAIKMAAFARKDIGPINSRDDFKGHDYIVSYVSGYYIFDHYLQGVVPENHIHRVGHWREGISQLIHQQSDVFIGVEKTILQEIRQHRYPIHKIGELLSINLYPYFNSRHEQLALDMAKVIQQMKQEGAFKRLVRDAGNSGITNSRAGD